MIRSAGRIEATGVGSAGTNRRGSTRWVGDEEANRVCHSGRCYRWQRMVKICWKHRLRPRVRSFRTRSFRARELHQGNQDQPARNRSNRDRDSCVLRSHRVLGVGSIRGALPRVVRTASGSAVSEGRGCRRMRGCCRIACGTRAGVVLGWPVRWSVPRTRHGSERRSGDLGRGATTGTCTRWRRVGASV